MIQDTLQKIEQRLATSTNLSPENRNALEALVKDLRQEVESLNRNQPEQADSIAGFTEASTREALRTHQDPDLLDLSLNGLQQSVREFEISHPHLTSVVNGICQQLSNLGI